MTALVSDVTDADFSPISPTSSVSFSVRSVTKSNGGHSKKDPEVKMRSLQEHVDHVELGLAAILGDCRGQMEEVLSTHLVSLEKLQMAHDLELATLRAENTVLRQKLGVPHGDAVQGVVLNAPVPVVGKQDKKKKEKANKDDDDDRGPSPKSRRNFKRETDDDDDKELRNKLASKIRQGPPVAAGAWQSFVAWVPIGSALLQAEAWNPLRQQDLQLQPGVARGKSFGPGKSFAMSKDVSHAAPYSGVLPGFIGEEKGQGHKDVKAQVVENNISFDTANDSDSSGTKEGKENSEKFELIEVWKTTKAEERSSLNRPSGTDNESSAPFTEDEAEVQKHSVFILNPDSNLRISWDLSSLFMVVYDMIMIPMFVFNLSDMWFLVMMEWVTRLFWTFDMGWSCCTGIVMADGSVEYRWQFILKRYVKSWFAMDLFIVSSDWSGLLFTSGGMGLSKLARISRIARVVRLLRLVRMQEVIANITERIQSDQIHFVMQICKPLILLLFFGHVIACGWWGVGLESGESAWIDEAGYTDQGLETQYLVSLHWSLAQFSTGMGEVTSSSAGEQMYAVFVCVVSFMVSLVMTSVLTSNLTQKYIIGGAGARQLSTLKKYLKQNNVPKNLTKRVCRNAKHAISGDLTPDTVDLLGVISEPLKIEMHFEIYSRILAWHPFFHDYLTDSTGGQVMRRVCHQAMSMLLLASGDVVFSSGEEPSDPKMYIVVSGQLEYLDSYGETTVLHERMWAAEAAIWTQWKHRGTLTATSDVKLALLDAETFQYICKRQMKKQKKGFTPKRYAGEFVEEMNNVDDLTDICTDQT